MSEPSSEVLYAIGRGVAAIQADLRQAEGERDAARSEATTWSFRHQRVTAELDTAKANLEDHRKRLQRFEEQEPRAVANLERLDRITLAISELIESLTARRDTAKTKSEGLALGHVIAELLAIYGPHPVEGK